MYKVEGKTKIVINNEQEDGEMHSLDVLLYFGLFEKLLLVMIIDDDQRLKMRSEIGRL
jgi:hypothetical protein